MNTAYRVRIYPNTSQQTLIDKTIGCCRFIYNKMLAERIAFYESNKNNKTVLYNHKYKTEKEYKNEYQWLKEVDSVALQQANRNLYSAYHNFFNGISNYPRFHKKHDTNSYRTISPAIKIDCDKQKICLPKLGWVKYKDGRENVNGKIINATVTRTYSGKYYCSIIMEIESIESTNKPIAKVMGLDMSLSKFYVDQNGNSPDGFERFYRNEEKKLAHYQRIASRRKHGSNNRAKANHKVAILNERIANKRKDFQDKLSKKLVTENDMIVIEDLNIRGMASGLHLGKSVNDLAWSRFVYKLKYKGNSSGCKIILADRFFPSSKTCSNCGYKSNILKLSDREWTCPICGKHLDRDTNAAINLVNYGLGAVSPEVTPVETTVHEAESRKQEYILETNSI